MHVRHPLAPAHAPGPPDRGRSRRPLAPASGQTPCEPNQIAEAVPEVRRFVEARAPELRSFATDISIDVLPPGVTKREGLAWLAERTGISPAEIAYTGDSEGDVEALQSVGLALAPANAGENVRSAVRDAGGIVIERRVLGGTLDGYRRCVERNREETADADRRPSTVCP